MINRLLFRLLCPKTDTGASVVEYALLVAMIALVCIGAVAFLGQTPKKPFSTVGNSINN